MSSPKVSVCVITYNHEKYIRQCLQSIIEQKTVFDFEVIVADDCSTDGTLRIVHEFAERYPSIVRVLSQNENTGGSKNFIDVHNLAKGEYVAHMDGDDFMLPDKIRIQSEELDKNPDCTICVHEVNRYDQSTGRYLAFKPKAIPKKSDIRFLLMNLPFFVHSSKMYRSECHKGLKLGAGEVIDCYLHVHHALTGKILYLKDVLGVYRVNLGLSIDQDNINESTYKSPNLKMVDLCIEAVEYSERSGVEGEIIKKAKAKIYFDFSYNYLLAKDYEHFKYFIKKSVLTAYVNSAQLFFVLFSKFPMPLFLLLRLRSKYFK